MKAVLLHAYGDAEALRVEEVLKPQPGADEVLIRIEAGPGRGVLNAMTYWRRPPLKPASRKP